MEKSPLGTALSCRFMTGHEAAGSCYFINGAIPNVIYLEIG